MLKDLIFDDFVVNLDCLKSCRSADSGLHSNVCEDLGGAFYRTSLGSAAGAASEIDIGLGAEAGADPGAEAATGTGIGSGSG